MIRGGLALALALGVSAAPAGGSGNLIERAAAAIPKTCALLPTPLLSAVRVAAATPYCSDVLKFKDFTAKTTSTSKISLSVVTKTSTQVATITSATTVSKTTTIATPKVVTGPPSKTVTAQVTVTETDLFTFEFTDIATVTSYLATALHPAATATTTAWANCGKYGSDNGQAPYNTISDPLAGDFYDCQDACNSDENCLTFAYSDGQACLLFNVPFASNFMSLSTSPYVFFDRNCPDTSDPAANSKRRHKRAVAMPPGLKAFKAAAVSQACSCLGITSRTITSTSTVTVAAKTSTSTVITKTTSTFKKTITVPFTKQATTTVIPKNPTTVTRTLTTSVDAGAESIFTITTTEIGRTTVSAGHTVTLTLTAGASGGASAPAAPSATGIASVSASASVSATATVSVSASASTSASASATATAGAGNDGGDNSGGDTSGGDDNNGGNTDGGDSGNTDAESLKKTTGNSHK